MPYRAQASLIKRADFATVEFEAAANDVIRPGNQRPKILRPIHEGRDSQGSGCSKADYADTTQVLALEDGVDALRCAQHSSADVSGGHSGSQHHVNGLDDAGRHIRGCRGLSLGEHATATIEHDRVRIRATDVYAKPYVLH